jgi:hypothetical protein
MQAVFQAFCPFVRAGAAGLAASDCAHRCGILPDTLAGDPNLLFRAGPITNCQRDRADPASLPALAPAFLHLDPAAG